MGVSARADITRGLSHDCSDVTVTFEERCITAAPSRNTATPSSIAMTRRCCDIASDTRVEVVSDVIMVIDTRNDNGPTRRHVVFAVT